MIVNNLKEVIAFTLFCICFSQASQANHAFGMGYEPKYKEDFSHFDYVNPDAPKGGTLNLSVFGTFETLNPYLLKGLFAMGLDGLVFEHLGVSSMDEPFSMYGHLAKEMILAEDELSITFILEDDATFSDGSPVLAEDVKATFEYLLSDKSLPFYRFYYGDVKDVEVLGSRIVKFNFKNRNAELHMILIQLPVFSPNWIGDKEFDEVITDIPIGSGPYVVDSFGVGSYITFKRNPNYWGKDKNTVSGMYNYDQITFKYYKDTNVAREALKAGEFDFYFENTSKSWATEYNGPLFTSGKIITKELPDGANAGLQGLIFNLRRKKFQDKRVRQAMNLAFDFEWSNKNLFYGQYKRNNSYHSNSDLAARGKPAGLELAILKELGDSVPLEIFEEKNPPPSTAPPNSIRNNLIKAKNLLDEAGWTLGQDKVLEKNGERLEIDFLVVSPAFERILAPYAQNLSRIGIKVNYRTVDTSLYIRRAENFEFDMMVYPIGESESPGNEQKEFFHSSAADVPGSRNLIGIKDPMLDKLIDKVIYAQNREELVAATRAMDRVLWYGDYLVPTWYTNVHRVAYWDKFGIPEILPVYYLPPINVLQLWWAKSAE
ncbi:MAG: microcin C transport system substrate-binding protein [Gammaproteobacteria bacterium]|jgi:microcin C transport system substrate-binding protein